MGPDEFHDGYPDSATPGLNNNAYTNIMAVWVLCRALEILELLSDVRRAELTALLGLTAGEIERWDDISRRMFVQFHDNGIISQFEGYENLRDLDWEDYRTRYGNIQRLDLILEGENDSANNYKLSKQPDVLMLFYLFSAEEIGELFERMGYPFEYGTIPLNVAYYTNHSSHGSTLSRVVYAWVLARSDRPRAIKQREIRGNEARMTNVPNECVLSHRSPSYMTFMYRMTGYLSLFRLHQTRYLKIFQHIKVVALNTAACFFWRGTCSLPPAET